MKREILWKRMRFSRETNYFFGFGSQNIMYERALLFFSILEMRSVSLQSVFSLRLKKTRQILQQDFTDHNKPRCSFPAMLQNFGLI